MNRSSTALGVLLILTCGLVLAWPILSGGWLTYLDNPAHVAEIHSLALDNGGGWSDIAWCGYPLGRLHSPLFFGGLAALERAGLDVGALYAALVVLGFLTPPLILLGLGWYRAGGPAAVILAWLLLVQKTSLVGYSSPLGGMWTFYLSCGAFLLLAARLADRRDRFSNLFWIAGLYGLLGLTHLFTLVPAVLLFAVHMINRLSRRRNLRFLWAQMAAAVLGAVASAAYWAPLLLAGDGIDVLSYNLPPLKLLARLLWGVSMVGLRRGDADLFAGFHLASALPQMLLVAAGIAGFVLDRRRPARDRSTLVAYGFSVAAIVLGMLLVMGAFQAAGRDIDWLGHVSWRLLYFVRLGLALAAIPLLARLAQRLQQWTTTWKATPIRLAGAVVLVVMSLGLGAPLRAVTLDPAGTQMKEIRHLWTWLAANRRPDWGRVYVQDPFGSPDRLGNSHIMALTSHNTGVDQVGPLYAGSPFPTVSWLVGESRKIFGKPMRNSSQFLRMLRLLPLANTTRLVLHWPDLAREMVSKGYARDEFHTEHYTVLALTDYPASRWVEPLTGKLTARAVRLRPGQWQVTTEAGQAGGSALLKASWSPHWQVVSAEGPGLEMDQHGLIRLTDLPAGHHVTVLEFRQPRWPDTLSVLGWAVWLLLLSLWRFRVSWRSRLTEITGSLP